MTKTKRSKKANSKYAAGGYEVGYGKPPKKHQFQPGHSGNPKGRPKGGQNAETIARKILDRPLKVREGGKERKTSTLEGIMLRFADKALNGDAKAADLLLKLYGHTEEAALEGAPLDMDDREIFDALMHELEAKREEKRKEKNKESPDAE